MAAVEHSPPRRGLALMRYIASVFLAIAVIVAGLRIAADHWPCEFMAKGSCENAKKHAMTHPVQQQAANLGQ
jgi:hypothetical protein